MYAATTTAFYFTANAGSSWSVQSATGLTPGPGAIKAITTPHVTADKHVFVATSTGVFASADRGLTFAAANAGLGSTANVTALNMVGTTLYATTNGGGFFTSTDNATTWTASNTGMTASPALVSMAISGSDIYVGVDGGGAYHSADGGATWTAIAGDIKNTFKVMAATGTYVFAATDAGLFQSSDNGATWTVTNVNVVAMTVETVSTGVDVFAATSDGGVLLTTDHGATWTTMNKGLGSTNSVALETGTVSSSTTNPDAFRLFYGTSDGGAYVSTNQGKGWSKVTAGAVYDFQYNFHKP
jgi:hypothetical protein